MRIEDVLDQYLAPLIGGNALMTSCYHGKALSKYGTLHAYFLLEDFNCIRLVDNKFVGILIPIS